MSPFNDGVERALFLFSIKNLINCLWDFVLEIFTKLN